MTLKFKVPLKERKDGAVYKAKIAVHYDQLGNGVTLAKPDLSLPVVEIEANSEGLAYKKLCEIFKPGDNRKIDGKGFLSMCEVGATARSYKTCEKHKQSYWYWDDEEDTGCRSCESDRIHEKYEQERREHEKRLIVETAAVLGCSPDEVSSDKIETVTEGHSRYTEGTYEGYGSMKKAAIRKVSTSLGCSEDVADELLKKLMSVAWSA